MQQMKPVLLRFREVSEMHIMRIVKDSDTGPAFGHPPPAIRSS